MKAQVRPLLGTLRITVTPQVRGHFLRTVRHTLRETANGRRGGPTKWGGAAPSLRPGVPVGRATRSPNRAGQRLLGRYRNRFTQEGDLMSRRRGPRRRRAI